MSGAVSPARPYGELITTALRVMTWNVCGRFGPWQEREAALIRTLETLAPDVVALQECWRDWSGQDQSSTGARPAFRCAGSPSARPASRRKSSRVEVSPDADRRQDARLVAARHGIARASQQVRPGTVTATLVKCASAQINPRPRGRRVAFCKSSPRFEPAKPLRADAASAGTGLPILCLS